MDTVLYYFSGTGNTLQTARDIAGKLGDAELISIPSALKDPEPAAAASRVGILFPVYMWGLPLIVAEFTRKLKVKPDTYLFGVATYGGFPAGALLQLRDILGGRDLSLVAGFGVRMPGNYTPMYGAIPVEKQEKMFAAEKEKTARIAETVRAKKSAPIEANLPPVNWFFSGLFYRFSAPHIPAMDKGFFVDDRCTGCGLCARVCPVNNIAMNDGRPEWLHRCEQCLSCLQWCPEESVQLGKSTRDRKRYHHPSVAAGDMTSIK